MLMKSLGTRLSAAAVVLALSAPCAIAQQQDAKLLLTELMHRHTALENLASLERIAARIIYVEGVALLSEFGEWPEEAENWPEAAESSKLVYDLFNLHGRMTPELASLRRTAARDGVYDESEAERLAAALDNLELMIEESQSLYTLLEAGQLDDANTYFRDVVRTRYQGIVADSYSIGSGITRDISQIGLDIRLLD